MNVRFIVIDINDTQNNQENLVDASLTRQIPETSKLDTYDRSDA